MDYIEILDKYGLSTALVVVFTVCGVWLTRTLVNSVIIPFAQAHIDLVRETQHCLQSFSKSLEAMEVNMSGIKKDITENKGDMDILMERTRNL